MSLKPIIPGQGSGGSGESPTDEQLQQIGLVANDAKQIAQGAKTESAAAAAKADAAKTAADGYSAQITAAQEAASDAVDAATAAGTKADTAKAAADAVVGTASDAQTKAETAQTAATNAGTKADAAKATADALDARVTAADTKAENAKTTADTAKSTADTAKATADTAKATADGYSQRITWVEDAVSDFDQRIGTANSNASSALTAAEQANTAAQGFADDIAAATAAANTATQAAATADTKAVNAGTKAQQALDQTAEFATDIQTAQTTADGAVTTAGEALTAAQAANANLTDLQNTVGTNSDDIEANAYEINQAKLRLDTLEAGGTGDSLPLSYWLSVWGDSRTEQNWNSARNAILCRGYAYWAELLSGRVRVHKKYNFGKSGDDISQLYARMTADTANDQGVKPSEVPAGPAVLFIGTNSVMQDLPLETLMTQLLQCITWLKGKGHKVFVVADYPRGLGSIMSVNEQKLMNSYVDAIRALALTDKDIRVIDPWPYAADPSVNTCVPLTGMVNPDGLHPSPGFGFIIGKLLAEAFEEAGFRKIVFPAGSQGLYDSVLNPKGNLIKNPNFSVTQDAAATPTTITGVVPTDWNLTLGAGLSLVGSVVTVKLPDGTKRKAWRATITGTTATDFLGLQVRQGSLKVSRVAEGEILEGHFEYIVGDNPVNLISPACNVATNDNATSALGGATTGGTNKDLTIPEDVATGFYGITRAPEYVHQALTTTSVATTLAFECRPYFGTAGTVNVTIDFLSASLKKKAVV